MITPPQTGEYFIADGAGGFGQRIGVLMGPQHFQSFTGLRRVNVPVILFLGRHDTTTPSPIAARWIGRLSAPSKRIVWFEHSAHLPMIEEPGRTFAALLDHVRPLTRSSPRK